jgi:serine phosphatase RsbU (regulator of sigma subunit)
LQSEDGDSNELSGADREALRKLNSALAPREIIERLVDAGEAWAEGRPQDDDITFFALKVKL